MAAAALVLGIISTAMGVFTWGIYGLYAGIIGVVGIILGAVAKKNNPSGLATAGLVLSIIGTALSFVLYIACVAIVTSVTI